MALLVLGPRGDGDERAQLQPLGAHAARVQPVAQRAADHGQDDVVDGAAERVLDLLEVLEPVAHDAVAAVRADLDVQRRRRCRVQPRPGDLAEALGRLAERAQRRLRVAHDAHRGRRGARRGPRQPDRAAGDQLGARRLVLGLPRLVGVRDLRRDGREVEHHGRQVDAADAVDERVMGLADQREATVVEPFDDPHLPQRLGAIQLLGHDPRDEAHQLLLGARRGQRGLADVVLEVEGGVVDPQRAAGLHRRLREPLAVARHEVQPRPDVVEHLLVARRRALADDQAADVHVRRGSLLRQERRVDCGQPIQVLLCHPRLLPMFTSLTVSLTPGTPAVCRAFPPAGWRSAPGRAGTVWLVTADVPDAAEAPDAAAVPASSDGDGGGRLRSSCWSSRWSASSCSSAG